MAWLSSIGGMLGKGASAIGGAAKSAGGAASAAKTGGLAASRASAMSNALTTALTSRAQQRIGQNPGVQLAGQFLAPNPALGNQQQNTPSDFWKSYTQYMNQAYPTRQSGQVRPFAMSQYLGG